MKEATSSESHGNPGLWLYIAFCISWFLHLGTRIPALGAVRIDLLLVCVLALIAASQARRAAKAQPEVGKWLMILLIYSVATIPLVEWPGSALVRGIPELAKAVVFYYFTVAFVVTEPDLKKFLAVFVGCQLFRVLEPLYLHATEGYWGSFASMENWEYLDRLSGAPSDVVNPNGLAFIICTVLPFLYFLSGPTATRRIVGWLLIGLCVYALALTGSRSGMVGLAVVFAGIVLKSRKPLVVAAIGLAAVFLSYPFLDADMQDRYLSIVGMGEKNRGTAEGRFDGIAANFSVTLRRPVFGHGIGTSREANANFAANDQPAHNLYAEVAQELGFVGLGIFLMLMRAIALAYRRCGRQLGAIPTHEFLRNAANAGEVWLWMTFVFSFASYGLNSYEWYLIGGLVVVVSSLASQRAAESESDEAQTVATGGNVSESARRRLARHT